MILTLSSEVGSKNDGLKITPNIRRSGGVGGGGKREGKDSSGDKQKGSEGEGGRAGEMGMRTGGVEGVYSIGEMYSILCMAVVV